MRKFARSERSRALDCLKDEDPGVCVFLVFLVFLMIVERECKSVVFVGDGGGRKWGRERDERVVWECEGGGGYIGRIKYLDILFRENI